MVQLFQLKNILMLSMILLWGCVCLGASVVQAEEIDLYEVAATLNDDMSLTIEETIRYDFGDLDRRGIYRTVPLLHHQQPVNPFKERVIDYVIERVERDGVLEPFTTYQENDSLVVRIGTPEVTISGVHTYSIVYTVTGGLSYYDTESPELYWDMIGGDWPVPIQAAVITLHDPHQLFAKEVTCYAGAYGENNRCEIFSPNNFGVTGLNAHQGVTIAQALVPERVSIAIHEKWNSVLIAVLLLLISLVGLGIFLYKYSTVHNPHRTVIAQYEPYPDVLPMYMGVLRDGRLDPRDITAGFLYLASEGFIEINKTTKKVLWLFDADDHEMTLKRPTSDAPNYFLWKLLELLFENKQVGTTVSLGEVAKDKLQVRGNVLKKAELTKSIKEDLIEKGFFEHPLTLPKILLYLGLFSVLVLLGIFFLGETGVVLLLPILFVTIILLQLMYRRRTRLGYEALNHIKGFREFLSVTGKDRFKFHNAPDKNPKTFLEYLPYAVALGVEKEWAEVFKDITIPEPEWYHSNTGVHSFAATDLTNSLSGFSTALSTSTSSSGSSSSGAGGGGFSGGGSGGGGGGSW